MSDFFDAFSGYVIGATILICVLAGWLLWRGLDSPEIIETTILDAEEKRGNDGNP